MEILLIHKILFWVFLVDSILANIIFYFGKNWYIRNLRTISCILPPVQAWAVWYLLLVLWAGIVIYFS